MGLKVKWWHKHPNRLQVEISQMAKKFPHFLLGEAECDRTMNGITVARRNQQYWLGDLKTISGHIYKVVLTYPDFYPGGEIKAFVISPEIIHHNHRYGDGRLCLYSNDHGGNGQGAGPAMTAVSYIAWTATWLHAHEIFEIKGIWPENNFFIRN